MRPTINASAKQNPLRTFKLLPLRAMRANRVVSIVIQKRRSVNRGVFHKNPFSILDRELQQNSKYAIIH
jgi:hypothetical protein